tara:strand:+ start:642 stop:836 length:195 start_codon:yes stop_codon:yes gene_type:complete
MIRDDGVYETILEIEKEIQWRIEVAESELLDLCKSIGALKKALVLDNPPKKHWLKRLAHFVVRS